MLISQHVNECIEKETKDAINQYIEHYIILYNQLNLCWHDSCFIYCIY